MRLHRTCNQRSAKSRKQLNVISHQTIKGMRNLLEKYYNINFYCSYKLQFFIFRRMLNLFYWLSFSKWKNGYINGAFRLIRDMKLPEWIKVSMSISAVWRVTPHTSSVFGHSALSALLVSRFSG